MIDYFTLGCDHIGHKPYRPQEDDISTTKNHIGHTENPYRSQTISATPYQPQNIMVSLLRLIISLLHVYVVVSYCFCVCSLYVSAVSDVIQHDLFVSLFHFRVCLSVWDGSQSWTPRPAAITVGLTHKKLNENIENAMACNHKDDEKMCKWSMTVESSCTWRTATTSQNVYRTRIILCPQVVKMTMDVTWDLQRRQRCCAPC